eukprot:tig00001095_g7020.t1
MAALWRNIQNDENLMLVANSMKLLLSDLKEWNIADLTLGLHYLARSNQSAADREPYKGEAVTLTREEQRRLHRFAQLALAAYCGSDGELLRTTSMRREDLLWASWRSSTHRPAFYIALDPQTKSLLLCIRGTKQIKDALTDLTTSVHAFQGGHVHMGMLMAALWFRQHVVKLLHSHLKLHRDSSLRILGHSLGAGTAALLAIMLQHEFPGLECYAFAPPACVSEGVLPLTVAPRPAPASAALPQPPRPLVTSVVLGDDVVPRFCTASVAALRREVLDYEWGRALLEDLERSRLGQLARRSQEFLKAKATAAERESPTLVAALLSTLRTVATGAENLKNLLVDSAQAADARLKLSASAARLWEEAREWRERRAAAAAGGALGPSAPLAQPLRRGDDESEWTDVAAEEDPYAIPLQELDPGREEVREAAGAVISAEAQARREVHLFPPGALLHLVRGPSGGERDVRAFRVEAGAFGAIKLSGAMLRDHALEAYVAALDALPFRLRVFVFNVHSGDALPRRADVECRGPGAGGAPLLAGRAAVRFSGRLCLFAEAIASPTGEAHVFGCGAGSGAFAGAFTGVLPRLLVAEVAFAGLPPAAPFACTANITSPAGTSPPSAPASASTLSDEAGGALGPAPAPFLVRNLPEAALRFYNSWLRPWPPPGTLHAPAAGPWLPLGDSAPAHAEELDRSWLLQAPPGLRLLLEWTGVSLLPQGESVVVDDWFALEGAPLLDADWDLFLNPPRMPATRLSGSFSSALLNGTYLVSTGPLLHVRFRSEVPFSGSSWGARLRAVDCALEAGACGTSTGLISASPLNYRHFTSHVPPAGPVPSGPDPHIDRRWLFSAPPGYVYRVRLENFGGTTSSGFQVEIAYDGFVSSGAYALARLTSPAANTSGSLVSLMFRAVRLVELRAGPAPRTFDDGSGDAFYPLMFVAFWRIEAPAGQRVLLELTGMSMRRDENLVTYDGSSNLARMLNYYNGVGELEELPPPARRGVTSNSVAYVSFDSNQDEIGDGFEMSYRAVDCAAEPALCLLRASNYERLLDDGSGPVDYANGLALDWSIEAAAGQRVFLRSKALGTQPGRDLVRVYEGASAGGRLLANVSGSLPAGASWEYLTEGPAMFVTFTTDGNVTGEGFSAGYQAAEWAEVPLAAPGACVDIDDGSGPDAYAMGVLKFWWITAAAGQRVHIAFTEFSTEKGWDIVTINDGPMTAPRLAELSGSIADGDVPVTTFVTSSGTALLRDPLLQRPRHHLLRLGRPPLLRPSPLSLLIGL